MAQHSGFFNAINTGGVYDRKYNANDYTNNLAVVISNGVLRSTADDLKVTASGMTATVAAGRAWIKGHYYYNDTDYAFQAVSAPIAGQRYDRIFLRFNNSINARSISLVYQQGTASASPARPAPTRNDTIYDLVLADIFVGTNATSVVVTDKRADADLCGWVYSTSGDTSFFTSLDGEFEDWFGGVRDDLATTTIFKNYLWKSTLSTASQTVTFNIPQYDGTGVTILDVYVNGIKRNTPEHYSVSGSTITFAGTLIAGTQVTVSVYKSIDGTGIESVVDEVTTLQNEIATIQNYAEWNYDCTGTNDNISLSQIAQAIYAKSYTANQVTPAAAYFLEEIGGNAFLATLADDAQFTVNVFGKLGITTPFSGEGTAASRYKWFSLGVDAVGEMRVIFDFKNADTVRIPCAGNTKNIVFYGTDMNVLNCSAYARCTADYCDIEMVSGRYNTGNINFENCKLKIVTTGLTYIAENGNFTNCYVYISSANNHALCFVPETASLIRLIGGTYYAYTASQLTVSAIIYTYGTATEAVVIAHGINCPKVTVTSFYQTNMCIAYAGRTIIDGAITILPNLGSYLTASNIVAFNKR